MPDNDFYNRALLMGAGLGGTSAIETALENGADINTRNSDDRTAYMLACKNGHINAVIMLVGKNAKMDLVDKDNKTGRMLAQEAGHEMIIDYIEAIGG